MNAVFALTSVGAGDMAIDLGTANTLVYLRGHGIVVSEPSVVALDVRSGDVHAVGHEANRMIGRTPAAISATRPLRHGVIADFEVTEAMLRHFIAKVHRRRFAHPRVVMCVPSGVTDVEKRAVEEACYKAGARRAYLIEESIAAAIGAGLEIAEARGRMVVDVGGGTSEVAVISLGGIVVSRSLRIGGYDLDDAILAWVKRRHSLAIGSRTAEGIKVELASAAPSGDELEAPIRGRDLISGLPKLVALRSDEVREAIEDAVGSIVDAVKDTLEATPPELAADIAADGIVLTGGGSLLRGFGERLAAETGMEVRLAESPLTCVATGAGQTLDELGSLEASARPSRRR